MMGKVLVPPKEYHTKLQVETAHFRAGLIAFEQGYDLLNVLSLSPLAQETYWKLKNEREV